MIDSLYLDDAGPKGTLPPVELRRYTLDLDGGAVRSEPLADGSLELPRIDYGRRNTRDYSYAYFTGSDDSWIDRLVKVDVRDGARSEWRADGCYPGEPVFVRRPAAERRGRRAWCCRWCSTRTPAARSCSCSTPARSRSWRAPRRRTTSRSASTGSTSDETSCSHPTPTASGWPSACAPPRARGRLTPTELEERLERAFSARTEAELEPLVADLPAQPVRERRHAHRGRPDFGPFVFVSLMLVGIWALTGMGYFWPVWPIAGWGISFVAPGSLRGPCRRRSSQPGLLDGQVAIVSGGGSGLGRATALELAALGAQVVVCGRRLEPLEETVAPREDGRVEARACDIREEDQVEALVDGVLERHGQIDLLVNNAGGQYLTPAEDITPEGLPHGDPAERGGHLADDPRRGDAGHDSGRAAAARS